MWSPIVGSSGSFVVVDERRPPVIGHLPPMTCRWFTHLFRFTSTVSPCNQSSATNSITMDRQASSPPTFETLPVDLLSEVMLILPDIASLDNLIIASPACYQVYQASKDFIAFKVFCTQISPQIFREALACFQACKLRDRQDDYVE